MKTFFNYSQYRKQLSERESSCSFPECGHKVRFSPDGKATCPAMASQEPSPKQEEQKPDFEVKTDLEKHLAITLRLVQKERDSLQSRIRELEQQLETFERAERIDSNSWEERCSEASHYTWLDDQYNAALERIKELEAGNAEMVEVLTELMRFMPSLRTVVYKDFMYPGSCLRVFDKIESILNS